MADEGRVMVTDEMVERVLTMWHGGPHRWPNDYPPHLQAEMREDMKEALSAVLPSARERARREALEEAINAVGKRAMETGRQECCGSPVGYQEPECCGSPLLMLSDTEAATAIRALASQPAPPNDGWQPMETAPKTTTARLVWVPERQCTFAVYWNAEAEDWAIFGGGYLRLPARPSHWRPLPAPPKEI